MTRNFARLITIFFIVITFFSYLFSQSNQGYSKLYQHAEKLFNSGEPTALTDSLALVAYTALISELSKDKITNPVLVDCYLKSGILEMTSNRNVQAMNYFRTAISIVRNNPGLSDSLLFKPFLYAGTVHYALNNLDSAEYNYKKAESIYDKWPALSESERLFNKLGALYYETGDYNKSISYFEKALFMVRESKTEETFFVVNYKNNIATALMKLGKYDSALQIFHDLLNYPQPGDELYFNIGNTYFEKNDYSAALFYVRKIRTMDFEKFTSLTKIYIHLKQYDSARIFLEKARQLYLEKKTFNSEITYAIILKYSGDLKAADGRPFEALRDYQSAIIHLDPSFADTSVLANPESFTGLLNFAFLFETMVAKAGTEKEIGNIVKDDKWMEETLQTYSSALSLTRHIEKTYFSDDARLFLKSKVNPATEDAVDLAAYLFDKTKNSVFLNMAFAYAENNKATVLQTGVQNLELNAISGLPVELVASEKSLRSQLARLEIHRSQLKDSLTLAATTRKIHDIEISLVTVQNKLDNNPAYHKLKYSNIVVDLDSIQNNLTDPHEAILSYYYTENRLICFYVTKDEKGFSSTRLDKSMFKTIADLRTELIEPGAAGSRSLHLAGSVLFRNLILPVYEKIREKNRLIIIPYNEINYIPFEMLIDSRDQLLLKSFSISYTYAAGFLSGEKTTKAIRYNVLAMAPFSDREDKNLILPSLPNSENEVDDLPGKKYLGSNAVKVEFIRQADRFPIIHLATHAVANDSNVLGTYVEFYGRKSDPDSVHRLYEKEIYTLDLKSTRLVILSACETGNGLLINGEGLISLSRAFSYAGCKTVVTSLWKADEIATAFIMKRLHHYLQKGLAVDEALRQAKIDYLENNDISARYKNPAFWANIVVIGDHRPVMEKESRWIYWALLLTLMLIIILMSKKITGHKRMPG